jgi:hypothetical protein
LRQGTYTTLDDPKGMLGSTDVLGISAQGDIVGVYADSTGTLHGYLLRRG